MKLINIGFGNMVSAGRLIAIVSPESAPIKRITLLAHHFSMESGELTNTLKIRRPIINK